MKLLIVEDEAKIADYLRKGLAEEGYVIDVAANGIDGLHMASHGNYDLIVLDTMLPGIDGFGLLAALRQSKQTPVIMLTARHRIEDRVRGLKTGADDYLVKPFACLIDSCFLNRIQKSKPVEHDQHACPHVRENSHPHRCTAENGEHKKNGLDAQRQNDVLPQYRVS